LSWSALVSITRDTGDFETALSDWAGTPGFPRHPAVIRTFVDHRRRRSAARSAAGLRSSAHPVGRLEVVPCPCGTMGTIRAMSAKDCDASAIMTCNVVAPSTICRFSNYVVVLQSLQMGRAGSGRNLLIQMPNLPRALNIWLKPTSVASCEPRRTVTVACGVSQPAKVAAPTKSKMRISNIPAVASFLKLPDPSVKPSDRCPTALGTATSPEGQYSAARTASTGFPG
jgi:hypothetical protein